MRDIEMINVINGSALNIGGRTTFGQREFPLGEGWYKMKLRFNLVVVIGTGTTPITEGELIFLKNILLKTDRGEILCNLPGRALYKINNHKTGQVSRKDAIAAASGTYRVDLAIYFCDYNLVRPEDTILDTSRYNAIQLDVQVGTIADLFTTVGTATVTATLDCEIERSKGILPDNAMPIFHVSYDQSQPVDANTLTYIDIERSTDLALKRVYVHASSGSSAGVTWGGQNADDVQNLESIRDQSGFIVQERIHEMIQNCNKEESPLDNVQAGVTVFDFVRDGSIHSSLHTGSKSKLQYVWTNKAGVAANDIVSVAYEGIRTLK